MNKRIALVTVAIFALSLLVCAQDDPSKRPSPPAKAECKLASGKTATVNYSSPRAKGRKIFGGLVPFGKVWRTGANEATSLTTDTAFTVGGKDVPAGSYTLFTVPNADKWALVISKKTGEWGTDYPGEAEDLARVDMKVSKTAAPVENFTIAFESKGTSCTMNIDWESTRASVNFVGK